jgi:hypothetical protein
MLNVYLSLFSLFVLMLMVVVYLRMIMLSLSPFFLA